MLHNHGYVDNEIIKTYEKLKGGPIKRDKEKSQEGHILRDKGSISSSLIRRVYIPQEE